ncbi:MAG TPA: hypothetical protein VGM28_01470 [Candidatus Limnocylindrales bacterium]|jgi:hypothetical protein
MNAQPRPRRGLAARILALVIFIPILAAACTAGGGAAGGGDPTSVVNDALAKIAAQDVNGVAGLACAGQADKVKSEFDLSGSLASELPGVDTAALAAAVHIDTSGIKVGTPTVNGDSATVPLTGSMKMTFDADKIRPIFKQIIEAQGGGTTITDDQIDQMIAGVVGSGQDIPMDESLNLKQENGAWKICDVGGQ